MSKRERGAAVVRMQLRLDPDLHTWLEGLARGEHRSLNQQINHLLLQAKQKVEPPPRT